MTLPKHIVRCPGCGSNWITDKKLVFCSRECADKKGCHRNGKLKMPGGNNGTRIAKQKAELERRRRNAWRKKRGLGRSLPPKKPGGYEGY